MSISQFLMSVLNVILIIIAYCSIFNFIAMVCTEITVSTIICILLFIIMFIAQGAFSLTANQSPYIKHTYHENGKEYVISQDPNPNYPGDEAVRLAKNIYLLIPQGQAMEIGNSDTEYLYQMPIYSTVLIAIMNICGIYIFSRKELK